MIKKIAFVTVCLLGLWLLFIFSANPSRRIGAAISVHVTQFLGLTRVDDFREDEATLTPAEQEEQVWRAQRSYVSIINHHPHAAAAVSQLRDALRSSDPFLSQSATDLAWSLVIRTSMGRFRDGPRDLHVELAKLFADLRDQKKSFINEQRRIDPKSIAVHYISNFKRDL